MTKQEFNIAYDNGYKHGYEAGRNETTVGMSNKKIDILKRIRGKMDDDMLDTFYETKDEEREALSEAIKILDQGFDVDKHDAEVIAETVESIWGKPCADAINRKAVNEIMGYVVDYWREHAIDIEPHEIESTVIEQFEFTAKQLNELPPVNPQNDVLDKIRAEIEKQIERDFAFAKTEEVKVPVHYGTANGLQVAVRIIDKYRKEQTDADSD